jgi:hypothetical protein
MVETTIERNDVDLSKLFSWRKEFSIIDNSGQEQKVYIRLAGDADVNKARTFALRKSAEMRKKLRTEDSDEHFAFIPDKQLVEKDYVVESLILYSVREATLQAYKDVKVTEPKEPKSDATLEEQEKYQKEIDEYPKKVQDAVRKFVDKELDKKRKVLAKMEFDTLFEELEKAIITQQCETEMYAKFKEMCIYSGIYKDNSYKERLFNSFEEFENLPTEIKTEFVKNYDSLEISTEDLKN